MLNAPSLVLITGSLNHLTTPSSKPLLPLFLKVNFLSVGVET